MSMYFIEKEFTFSAAHHLTGLTPGHPCSQVHGHNYKVTISLKSQFLTPEGWVVDFRQLNWLKDWLEKRFDHKDLNLVPGVDQPTAENLARIIYIQCKSHWPETYAVAVQETDKTKATYVEAC